MVRGATARRADDPASVSAPSEPAPAAPGPLRSIVRAPRLVWALFVLNALLLGCWSVLTPTFRAPDEPNHADAVMRLVEGYGWGHVNHTFVSRHGVAATLASPFDTPQRPGVLGRAPIRATDATPRADRPSWADLGAGVPYQRGVIQQMTQHPPGYYYTAAAVVSVFGGDHQRWDRAVALMRLVSVLMVAPLPLLAWATAFRLTDDRRAGLAAAVFPLVVPELSHIGGVVNNDNALTLTGGLVLVGVSCVLRGDRRVGTAAFLGVTLGLALFSKGIALVLPPLVAAAYLVSWFRSRREAAGDRSRLPTLKAVLTPLAVAAVLAFAFGGWWYVANLIRYGAVQPSVAGVPVGTFLGNDPGRFTKIATSYVFQRYWSSVGWYEVPLPFGYVYAATAVVLALIVVAVVRARRVAGVRTGALLLLWPTLASYGLIAAQGTHYYLQTHHYRGLSGRYLFVGVVGLAAVVGIGATAFAAFRRIAPLVLAAAAVLLQGVTMWRAVGVWWRPRGGSLHQAWEAMLSWSAWSPLVVKGLVVLGAVAVIAVVAELVREIRRHDPDDGTGTTPQTEIVDSPRADVQPAANPA